MSLQYLKDAVAKGDREALIRYVRLHLWRRVQRTVRHKQDPAAVKRAERVPTSVKKKAAAGRIALGFLDECGFAPSQPVNYCWVRPGERKRIPYEQPQGRRYNAMALLVPAGPWAAFDWCGASRRHFGAADLLDFLGRRPATEVPLVLVLDNAGPHRASAVRDALPGLRARNVYLWYLPPYAPELNAIEPIFRAVKHLDLPERRYGTTAELEAAVDAAFARVEAKVLSRRETQPRLAA